ncbi:hypothetical protein RJ639_036388 [Escallonia herrerae]|uniref:peroxidase n=1 Tax=Escallonia herrerae TaxID=1293975 RepID=A0AA88WSS2_9ASTE|nr:hypothetical protein RJ639_036388 [Escallonia herrerae]
MEKIPSFCPIFRLHGLFIVVTMLIAAFRCSSNLSLDFYAGCDASILIQGNGTKRSDPANTSLDGFSVIDSIKSVAELFCPGTVSCADIVALAARDAVEITGGPAVQIPTGRRDGRISAASNARQNLVDTSFTLDKMIQIFSAKGLISRW